MNDRLEQSTNPHPHAPVGTGSHMFGDWVSVEEAVILCEEHGLNRTPKTIRKWASRSQGKEPGEAEITVRRQDTANSNFRWRMERVSLERKIEQELEHLRSAQKSTKENIEEPVHTGADPSELLRTSSDMENNELIDTNPSEPEETGTHLFDTTDTDIDFYKSQLEQKDQQITQINNQLERRDEQIMTMLERDRETNILISGLQQALHQTLGLEAPSSHRPHSRDNQAQGGDNTRVQDVDHRVE